MTKMPLELSDKGPRKMKLGVSRSPVSMDALALNRSPRVISNNNILLLCQQLKLKNYYHNNILLCDQMNSQ